MKKSITPVLVLAIGMVAEVAKADFVFGTPAKLGPTVNSPYYEDSVNISTDGLELYFNSPRPGAPDDFELYDIYVATRSNTDANWSEPVNLGPPVNSANNDGGPSISADGLTLYFSSARPGGLGDDDLWVTTRATTSDPWGPPVNLGSTVNSHYWDYEPSISADGLSLYFTSNRPGGYAGQTDIWVTERISTNDPWGEAVNLGLIFNVAIYSQSPSISADGRVLFFESNRLGKVGHSDIWMSRRTTTNDPWGEPVCLEPPVNTLGYEKMPDISADGRTLYFGYFDDEAGPWDLWQVSIDPIVDFNGDGKVDIDDLVIMITNWSTDEKLCDIGPMPWGDGIVDIEDLKVFVKYWEQENLANSQDGQ